MRRDIIIEDTTLRDGEQAPGIAWNKDQKDRIFNALVRAGTRWIEVGIPRMGGDELRFLEKVVERKRDLTLVAWNRGIKEDIAQSLDLGFEAIHIGLPTSDIHLSKSMGKSRAWVIDRAADLVKYAKDRHAFVSISAEDVGRTDPGFLAEYAVRIYEAGADRMRLSDTIGILTPEMYQEKVAIVARAAPIHTQCHCHNDFGLAVANTLAGLRGGARYFHVCVNGLGERAGMPDYAQMVMALKKLYGVDLGVDTRELRNLSAVVAAETRTPMPAWTPVVGDNVCAHESGIHAKGVLADRSAFEPFSAEEVGGTHKITIGKHSGRAALRNCLAEQGIENSDDGLLAICLERARATAIRKSGALTDAEVVAIYSAVEAEGSAAARFNQVSEGNR
jgi:isopropylmalate/homocitrate/citramalate synthase